MAILCREHDLLYIRVPATGSSVVAVALQNQLGGERVPAQPVRREGQTVVPEKHCTVPELVEYGVLAQGEINACLVAANVRNPFDRWTTYYQRRAGTEWIESSLDVLWRQLGRDRDAHDLSDSAYEQRRRDIEQWKRQQKRKGRLMRWVGFNTWMTYTLLRWGWKAGGGNNHEIGEYAFPMLRGVDVAIRQERLNEGLNRVLRAAGVGARVKLPEENTTSGKKPYTEYYSWTTRTLAERMFAPQMGRLGYDFEGPVDDKSIIFLEGASGS